ncbi:MAG: carbohydrate ABC transporter permease [Spirochaetes bacterium]|nr:carbohydrate ABC transporter permease [Spirochaetota bacterium]
MVSKKYINRFLVILVLVIWVIAWIIPLWNIFATATKTVDQYLSEKPWVIHLRLESLKQLFVNMYAGLIGRVSVEAILPALVNSLLYGVVGASIAIFIASLAAYSLSKMRLRARFLLFMLIFSGTIFPAQIYLIPLFKMYQQIHFYDKRIGLLCFYISICIPFCLLVLRNWFNDIESAIIDAARIDGCGSMKIFMRIIIPLSWPPFVTLFLLQFTWVWNDLIFGLTLTVSSSVRPIMPILANLHNLHTPAPFPVVLASTLVASFPTIILVIIFQRRFFKGLTMTVAGE